MEHERSRPMSILHTESSMELGGRELAVVSIAEGLSHRGHRVVLLAPPGSEILSLAKTRRIPSAALPMTRSLFALSVAKLLALLAEHRFELIHTHSSRDRWVAAVASRLSRRRPHVIIGRHHSSPIVMSRWNRLLYRSWSRCIVTTGGPRLQEHIRQQTGLDLSRVVSIPTGVDISQFTPTVDTTAVRRELSLSPTERLIGTVCFLRDYKGLHFFIEAARQVLACEPNCRFLIVGDGPERPGLQEQIDRLELGARLHLLGHRHDVPCIMAALDVFVVTSVAGETLTQTIPQALALKKPVVATDVGSIPDIILHDRTGLLVPPSHPEKTAEAILWMIRHGEEGLRMGSAGYELVIRKYTTAAALDQTERLYRQLLSVPGIREAGHSQEPPLQPVQSALRERKL